MDKTDIIRWARAAIRLSSDDASLTGFDQEQTILDKYEFLYWFAKEITAAALEQPEQEPVAWRYKGMMGMPWSLSDDGYYISCKRDQGYIVEPLYTHPPRREWHPLTDKEIRRMGIETPGQQGGWNLAFARAVEQTLKEKNHG